MAETEDGQGQGPDLEQLQPAVEEAVSVLNRHAETMSSETYDYTIISLLVSIAMGHSAPRFFCLETLLSAMSSLENIENSDGYMTIQSEEDISADALPTLHEAVQTAFGTALQDAAEDASNQGKH